MGFVSIAPRGTPVNKRLELSGNIRPVGGRNADNLIRPFKLIYYLNQIVLLKAFCRLVTASAALAKPDVVIVNADGFYAVFAAKISAYQLHNSSCSAVSDRTAINH